MNLYLVSYKIDADDDLDWHVIAGNPTEARDLWAETATEWHDQPYTGGDAQSVKLVLTDVEGPARVLDWKDAEDA